MIPTGRSSFRAIRPPSSTQHLICEKISPAQDDGISCLALAHNEDNIIVQFLNHYRAMGVRNFIIIDDHSTEGLYIGHGGGIFGTYSTAFYYFNREMTITLCITLDGSVEYISPNNLLNILLSSLPNE